MKKLTALLMAACLTVSGSLVVGAEEWPEAPVASGETVTIGLQPTSFCYPVIYAVEKGYFEDAGMNVDYIIFENGASMNEGLAAGQLDIGVNGLATIYTVTNDVCYLIGESETCATGVVYARPDSDIVQANEVEGMLGSKETLQGKTILGAASTLTQQQAYAYMDHFGLKSGTDFEFLSMDYSTANQAFIAGEGDLISVDGLNYVSEMDEAGMVRVCDYATATGSPYCSGLVAVKKICEDPDRRGDVARFLQVFYKSAAELMDNREEFEQGYLEWVLENGRNYTIDTVKTELDARPLFTAETLADPDYILGASTISASEFFSEIGVIEEDALEYLNTNYDASFLKDALGIEVNVATR